MWLEEDTETALAWIDYQAAVCGGCGFPRVETMDPANDRAYEADPVTCAACAAKDAEAREASKAKASGRFGDAALDGLYIGVKRKGGD